MMLGRLNCSNTSISRDVTLPKLIKATHHTIHSTLNLNTTLRSNNLRFSIHHHINTNAVTLIKSAKLTNINRSLYLHSIRSFAKKSHRTFNPGLSARYRELGLNANPWKVFACGTAGGLCGALCGVGGGIVMIPLLRTITTMTAHQIAGTSLLAVAAGALFATANYTLSSDVTRVPIAFNMAIFSMALSLLGAKANSMITGKVLSRITGISLMCCIPGILSKYDPTIPPPGHGIHRDNMNEVIRKHIEEEKFFQNNTMEWYRQNWHFCVIGCVSGFLSGLIGIGGGVVMTAAMATFTDLSQHEAVATSLMCIAPTAMIGSLAHYRMNHVVLPIAIILGASCSIGMTLSANIALEIPDAYLKVAFSGLLGVASVRMLL